MAVIHCKACGASYHYEKEGCCPNCGAYNRPPKRNRVTAEGIVQHMTDAAYEKRRHAQGKVCFEEKECHEEKVCFEDQTRQGMPQKKATNPGGTLIVVATVIIVVIGVLSGIWNRAATHHVEPEDYTGPVYTEPVENEPTDVAPADEDGYIASMAEEVTMGDGTIFTVWGWDCNDDEEEIVIHMEAIFTEDSDHEFNAVLTCADIDGGEETLMDYTQTQTDDGYIDLHFAPDRYSQLSPTLLELWEWEDNDLVHTQLFDLRR